MRPCLIPLLVLGACGLAAEPKRSAPSDPTAELGADTDTDAADTDRGAPPGDTDLPGDTDPPPNDPPDTDPVDEDTAPVETDPPHTDPPPDTDPADPTATPVGALAPGDLRLTEVLTEPEGCHGAFVEVHNTTADRVDLKGLQLELTAYAETIPGSLPVEPDGRVILAASGFAACYGVAPDHVLAKPPSTASTRLRLLAPRPGGDPVVLDEVTLTDHLDRHIVGTSLERDDADPDRWCAATDAFTPDLRATPDAPNGACPPPWVPTCSDPGLTAALAALAPAPTPSCGRGRLGLTAQVGDLELLLELQVRVMVDQAPGDTGLPDFDPGQTWEVDLAAGDGSAGSAGLSLGRHLAQPFCDDQIFHTPVTLHRWRPVAGRLTLEATTPADTGGRRFEGAMSIEGLVLEDEAGDRCAVPDGTWPGLDLGWLPG